MFTQGTSGPQGMSIASGTGESSPVLSPTGEVFSGPPRERSNSAYRMNQDGTERQRVLSDPILDLDAVSPDGLWLVVFSGLHEGDKPYGQVAYPLRGGSPINICSGFCPVGWAPNGKSIDFHFAMPRDRTAAAGPRTVVIPLMGGKAFPPLPASGFKYASEAASLPGARVVEKDIWPARRPFGVRL